MRVSFRVGLQVHKRNRVVPCGKCPACVNAKKSYYTFLFATHYVHSISRHKFYWATFTIAEESYSISVPPLSYWRVYTEQLRKNYGLRFFSYFVVVDIGEESNRSHLHAIISIDNDEDISSFVLAWRFGWFRIETLRSIGAIRYALSYALKTHQKLPFTCKGYRMFSYSKNLSDYASTILDNAARRYVAGYPPVVNFLGFNYSIPTSVLLRRLPPEIRLRYIQEQLDYFKEIEVGSTRLPSFLWTQSRLNDSIRCVEYPTPERSEKYRELVRLSRDYSRLLNNPLNYPAFLPARFESLFSTHKIEISTSSLPMCFERPGFLIHKCDPEGLINFNYVNNNSKRKRP